MKLLRLKIMNGFRGIHPEFECVFRERAEGFPDELEPIVCAGLNGSGKSNLLEALAEIFFFLHSFTETGEDDAEFFATIREESFRLNAFEIDYLLPPDASRPSAAGERHILVSKKAGAPPECFQVDRVQKIPAELRENLPEAVIGYSSGENERLSLPFFKIRFRLFDDYLESLATREFQLPRGQIFYLDQEFTQSIAICLYLLGDPGQLDLLERETSLKSLKQFRIILKRQHYDDGESSHNLLENLGEILERLRLCSTAAQSFQDDAREEHYFDFWVNKATRKAFKRHFGTPRELFSTLYFLLTLNLYAVTASQKKDVLSSTSDFVKETIPKLPSDQRLMRFKDVLFQKSGVGEAISIRALSDGETQLLHVLGMSMIYEDSNCLFLLDEPETHLNPKWRSQFITLLKQCLATPPAGEGAARGVSPYAKKHDMLVTTHSPFLISDSKPENVFVFEKKGTGVRISRPKYNTLGASISKITRRTFGQKATIGQQPMNIIREAQKDIDGRNFEKAVESLNLLGDSVEKMLVAANLPSGEEE